MVLGDKVLLFVNLFNSSCISAVTFSRDTHFHLGYYRWEMGHGIDVI